jgi:hypothetical protein
VAEAESDLLSFTLIKQKHDFFCTQLTHQDRFSLQVYILNLELKIKSNEIEIQL